jgi:sigma-B regulation protein RsbU (phosphoserine phosphatase)
MAVTKTLIKAKANEVDRPDKIMQEVNFELCQENDSAMFVTTFMAAFNVKTGVLSYCNAGHNPPYLIDNTGKVSQLPNTEGMALGVWEECQYSLQKITLQKNDIVFFYTDGINEAMDIDNNEFSYERLEEFLTTINDQVPRKITEMTLQTVKDFTGEAEQSDDKTLMVLKYLLG